jgi:hypothetical protein
MGAIIDGSSDSIVQASSMQGCCSWAWAPKADIDKAAAAAAPNQTLFMEIASVGIELAAICNGAKFLLP